MKYTFAMMAILLVLLISPNESYAQFPELAGILSIYELSNDCGATYNSLQIKPNYSAPLNSLYVYVRVTDSLNNLIATSTRPDQEPWQIFINPANHNFLLPDPWVPLPGFSAPHSRPWVWNVLVSSSELTFTEVRQNEPTYVTVFDPADYVESCSFLPLIPYVLPTSNNDLPIINTGNSENAVAVYNATDDNGDPALHIYDINDDGDGTLALEITQDIIAPYVDNPPSENTALMTSDNGKVTLYILDTGELQINSGPDAEGKTHVLIFDGIPPTNIYGYVIDPPLFP